MALRDELLARKVDATPYTILCPPGWHRIGSDRFLASDRFASTLEQVKKAGDPARYLELRKLMAELGAGLRERGVFELYLPPDDDNGFPFPASISVSPLFLPTGVPLDAALTRLARGAEVERPDGFQERMFLIRRTGRRTVDGSTVTTHAQTYIAPVPDGDDRRALVFEFSVIGVETTLGEELTTTLLGIGEIIMATMRFRRG